MIRLVGDGVVVTYEFVPTAYNPNIVGCDVETEEQAQKLDQEYLDRDGLESVKTWLLIKDIPYTIEVIGGD